MVIEAEVINIVEDYQQRLADGFVPMGDTAVLKVDDIFLVVNSTREQTFSVECFTDLGIDLLSKRVVVVKSSNHFRDSFEKLACTIITVATPGTLCPDFANIPYRHVLRPIWPLDNLPE